MARQYARRSASVPVGRILDIHINIGGHLPHKADMIHSPFASYAIGMVVDGRGTYRVGAGPEQAVEPGTLFSVYPGPTFHYGPSPGTTWNEYHLGGVGPGIQRWLNCQWVPSDGHVRRLNPASLPAMRDRFERFLALRRSDAAGDSDRAILSAERLLLELQLTHETDRVAPNDRRIEEALRDLRDHISKPVCFESLAQKHHLSYSLLRLRIKQRTGLSPAKYLTRVRCNAACRTLADTDQPIQSIAEAVGYQDAATFSKAFHRTLGTWPSAYRDAQRKMQTSSELI